MRVPTVPRTTAHTPAPRHRPTPWQRNDALVHCGYRGDHVGMSGRSLRESYQAIIGAVAAADEDALDLLIGEDIVDHDAVPGQAAGRAGIKYWVTMMHTAFADLNGVVEDTVVEGDQIAARVTWHGIHRGDFVGSPGRGARVDMQSVQILRFTDGVATEWWGTADVFGVLRQVGATVAPPT